MDILQQLAKTEEKEFTINGVKLLLKPLSGEKIFNFTTGSKKSDEDEGFELIVETLRPIVPQVTVEDVKKFDLKTISELMKAISELNGLDLKAE